MKIIMLIGIPACGKTSFCKKFFPDLMRVSRDDIGDTKKEHQLIENLLQKNNDFVIDDINHTKNTRLKIFEMAKKYNVPITGIFFDFGIERCLQQNSKREKPLPDAAIGRRNKELEPPLMDEGFDFIQRLDDDFRF